MMNGKTLIVLGNGPSLKSINLKDLSNYDTFGINGAFQIYPQINWFPTYFGILDPSEIRKWHALEINSFFEFYRYKIQKFFTYDEVDLRKDLLNIKTLVRLDCKKYPYDKNKFSEPLQLIVERITGKYKDFGQILKIFDFNALLREHLNENGIVRYLFGLPLNLKDDHVRFSRFNILHSLPKSLDEFYYQGGPSSMIACQIGICMGYKKIILLGVDCNYNQTKNKVLNKDNYWFDSYFPNGGFDIKEVKSHIGSTDIANELHISNWEIFKDALDINDVKVDIVNCNPNSKLEVFRKSILEKEL